MIWTALRKVHKRDSLTTSAIFYIPLGNTPQDKRETISIYLSKHPAAPCDGVAALYRHLYVLTWTNLYRIGHSYVMHRHLSFLTWTTMHHVVLPQSYWSARVPWAWRRVVSRRRRRAAAGCPPRRTCRRTRPSTSLIRRTPGCGVDGGILFHTLNKGMSAKGRWARVVD